MIMAILATMGSAISIPSEQHVLDTHKMVWGDIHPLGTRLASCAYLHSSNGEKTLVHGIPNGFEHIVCLTFQL